MGVTLNEISFEIGQFSRLVSEAVSDIAEGPPPSADDAASEARLQALGRFIVGYGTEEDNKTRELGPAATFKAFVPKFLRADRNRQPEREPDRDR